jgi:hypothetical protein
MSAEQESLLVAFGQSEADRTLGLRGWGDQLSQRLEDFIQLLVMLAEVALVSRSKSSRRLSIAV